MVERILPTSNHLECASTASKNMLLSNGPTKAIWIRCQDSKGHFVSAVVLFKALSALADDLGMTY